jgi:hypothetical protein
MVLLKQDQFKIALCHQTRRDIIILKLDFEKAFDKVEHELMIPIMKHKGLPDKWLSWMNSIFHSGTSAVLLNGVHSEVLHCKRGLGKEILCLSCFLFWQLIFFRHFLIQQKIGVCFIYQLLCHITKTS